MSANNPPTSVSNPSIILRNAQDNSSLTFSTSSFNCCLSLSGISWNFFFISVLTFSIVVFWIWATDHFISAAINFCFIFNSFSFFLSISVVSIVSAFNGSFFDLSNSWTSLRVFFIWVCIFAVGMGLQSDLIDNASCFCPSFFISSDAKSDLVVLLVELSNAESKSVPSFWACSILSSGFSLSLIPVVAILSLGVYPLNGKKLASGTFFITAW